MKQQDTPVIFICGVSKSMEQGCDLEKWLEKMKGMNLDYLILSYAQHHTKTYRPDIFVSLPGSSLQDQSYFLVQHVFCGVDQETEPQWNRGNIVSQIITTNSH